MKTAPKHPQEDLRLKSLEFLQILDTLPEEDFDNITFIASQICDCPIALISLVDSDRQWFKSKFGLEAAETPRDLAFCAHAILQDEVFEVPDSALDERFADNPLATGGPKVKFYAGAPLYSPDNMPIGTVCVIDSKARKLTDNQQQALVALSKQVTQLLSLRLKLQEIQEQEEKLIFTKTAFANITEGIVLQDTTGAIIDFNPAALSVLGLTAEQLLGKNSMDPDWKTFREDGSVFPGNEHPAMQALKTGQTQKNFVMMICRKDEQKRWININSVPIFLDSMEFPSHAVTSFADITEVKTLEDKRRQMEVQLSESARLSALGEMAAGIAHEINNPLAIIQGKALLMRKRLNAEVINQEAVFKDIESISNTVERIAKIIQGLRSYSRNAENDALSNTLAQHLIDDALSLCSERFKAYAVDLKFDFDPSLKVDCRPSQIIQILMNLLSNAFDAIQNFNNEKWVKIISRKNNNKVEFIVMDCGNGIPENVLKRIMDPFFTTKELGKGTGLGLSISKSIAQAHQGELFYQLMDSHTAFVLSLPEVHLSKMEDKNEIPGPDNKVAS